MPVNSDGVAEPFMHLQNNKTIVQYLQTSRPRDFSTIWEECPLHQKQQHSTRCFDGNRPKSQISSISSWPPRLPIFSIYSPHTSWKPWETKHKVCKSLLPFQRGGGPCALWPQCRILHSRWCSDLYSPPLWDNENTHFIVWCRPADCWSIKAFGKMSVYVSCWQPHWYVHKSVRQNDLTPCPWPVMHDFCFHSIDCLVLCLHFAAWRNSLSVVSKACFQPWHPQLFPPRLCSFFLVFYCKSQCSNLQKRCIIYCLLCRRNCVNTCTYNVGLIL